MVSIKLAKELIKTAKKIGIDVVKFQTETYDGLWTDKWLDKKYKYWPLCGKKERISRKNTILSRSNEGTIQVCKSN